MANSTWPAASLATLHDAARCLALAERDELVALPGGGLHRASWRLLRSYVPADQLAHRLLAESDVPVLSWVFRSLGAGGLIGVVNGRIRLASAAHDWLALTPTGQLTALRQIWRSAPEVASAWLPQAPGGQTRGNAWNELTEQLVASVVALPVDTWVLVADVLADLAAQAETLKFGVARNLPSVRQALARQSDLLATFLLAEVLPRLGAIVVQGEGAGQCLAVTAEGADWLRSARRSGKAAPGLLPDADPLPDRDSAAPEPAYWEVADDLRLTIPLEAPAAATFEALQFADLLSVGPPAQYRVTGASLERGVSHGYNLADVFFLLAHGAGRPLSGPAAAQLTRWREDLTVIQCEAGYRLRPGAPGLLTLLRAREPFRAATELAASGHWAFVSQAEADALMRYLRRAGYVLSPAGRSTAGADAPPALAPLLRRRLPLVPLATLVGVYGRLRARVPGLADLRLADLEQALLAALPAHSQAAVARLVASNDALIAQRCSAPDADPDAAAASSAPPATEAASLSLPGLVGITEIVNTAVATGTTLEVLYADTGGAVTQRRIRPLRLEERWGRQYVVAYCELRGDERSFRLDRIVQAEQL